MLAHVLRDGETEGGARYWGRTDVALSAEGWQQMRAAVGNRSGLSGPYAERAQPSVNLTKCILLPLRRRAVAKN